ncbi:uncharacterized protein [Typha angustifolia]|uniref:uncharacterized protein n=1 Tax=Typha angustifolia TaxID=59011 RepID=UPI003C2F705F
MEALMKRFKDLEVSQAQLREQLCLLLREERRESRRSKYLKGGGGGGSKLGFIPGFFANSPSRSILQHMGHAVYVSRSPTGEIFYWNKSAENLYGWKEYEALGRRVSDLLVNEECHPHLEKIMQRLNSGLSWSGQFQFRKRTGEIFMAMVTHSPLHEDVGLIGVITVSSDAAMLYDYKQLEKKPNAKRVQWCSQPQNPSSSLATSIFAKTTREGCEYCIPENVNAISAKTKLQEGAKSRIKYRSMAELYRSFISNPSLLQRSLANRILQKSSNHPGESNGGLEIINSAEIG